MVKELDAYRGFAIDAAPHHVDHRQRAAPVNLLLRDQADPLEVEDVGRAARERKNPCAVQPCAISLVKTRYAGC